MHHHNLGERQGGEGRDGGGEREVERKEEDEGEKRG